MEERITVACPRGDTLYIWRAGDTVETVAREYGVAESAVSPVKEGVSIDSIQPGDAVCITTRVAQNPPANQTPSDDRPPSNNRPPVSNRPSTDTCPFCDDGRCDLCENALCPEGYRAGTVRLGDTYETILRRYNVSYNAFRTANPNLNLNRLIPGQRFCAPPSGTRLFCPEGASSYIISVSGGIDSVAERLDTTAARLLTLNPSLAPGDFIVGRVICTG